MTALRRLFLLVALCAALLIGVVVATEETVEGNKDELFNQIEQAIQVRQYNNRQEAREEGRGGEAPKRDERTQRVVSCCSEC